MIRTHCELLMDLQIRIQRLTERIAVETDPSTVFHLLLRRQQAEHQLSRLRTQGSR